MFDSDLSVLGLVVVVGAVLVAVLSTSIGAARPSRRPMTVRRAVVHLAGRRGS